MCFDQRSKIKALSNNKRHFGYEYESGSGCGERRLNPRLHHVSFRKKNTPVLSSIQLTIDYQFAAPSPGCFRRATGSSE